MLALPSSILFPVIFLVTVVSAFPNHNARGGDDGQCNTGPVKCCNRVMSCSSPEAQSHLSSFGVSPDSVRGLVGLNCSPITGVGATSGAECTQQPICCADTANYGAVNYNCSPANVDL